jgi:hypothetical protein
MSQKNLILTRKENLKLLDTDKYRPKINCLEIDVNNTFKHELGKFLMYWMVKKGVPADCASKKFEWNPFPESDLSLRMDEMESMIESITKCNGVKLKKHEVPHIVSEARMRAGHRADLFVLDTGERVEIVNHCDKSTIPYDKETVVVRV